MQIRFDPSRKSPSGKLIPLESETGQPHQCPNSDYNRQKRDEVVATTNPPPSQQEQQQQIARETRSPKQYEGVQDSSIITEDLEQLKLVQSEVLSVLKDIRLQLLQLNNPNPEIRKASDLRKQHSIGGGNDIGMSILSNTDPDPQSIDPDLGLTEDNGSENVDDEEIVS